MSKEDAIQELISGRKLTHAYFSPNEWMKRNNSIEYEFEDGVKVEPNDFWELRTGNGWEKDWELFKD